jgi:hypothetical protein
MTDPKPDPPRPQVPEPRPDPLPRPKLPPSHDTRDWVPFPKEPPRSPGGQS